METYLFGLVLFRMNMLWRKLPELLPARRFGNDKVVNVLLSSVGIASNHTAGLKVLAVFTVVICKQITYLHIITCGVELQPLKPEATEFSATGSTLSTLRPTKNA